jgi:hypothetical protein
VRLHPKIVRALIIVLALIFLSGMALEKQVEAHIKVSKYRFPYLVLGSGTIQSTMPVVKADATCKMNVK